jgi:hypothetical protein
MCTVIEIPVVVGTVQRINTGWTTRVKFSEGRKLLFPSGITILVTKWEGFAQTVRTN